MTDAPSDANPPPATPLGPRIVLTRAVERSFPGHVEAGCCMCPHVGFESYYAGTGELVSPA